MRRCGLICLTALGSVSLLSPLGPTAANADPVLNHCVQAGALHIIYLHVLHMLVSVTVCKTLSIVRVTVEV